MHCRALHASIHRALSVELCMKDFEHSGAIVHIFVVWNFANNGFAWMQPASNEWRLWKNDCSCILMSSKELFSTWLEEPVWKNMHKTSVCVIEIRAHSARPVAIGGLVGVTGRVYARTMCRCNRWPACFAEDGHWLIESLYIWICFFSFGFSSLPNAYA